MFLKERDDFLGSAIFYFYFCFPRSVMFAVVIWYSFGAKKLYNVWCPLYACNFGFVNIIFSQQDASRGPAGEEQGQSNVNVMCRICFFGENERSERARRMLSCKSCGKKYHKNCLKNWAQHRGKTIRPLHLVQTAILYILFLFYGACVYRSISLEFVDMPILPNLWGNYWFQSCSLIVHPLWFGNSSCFLS